MNEILYFVREALPYPCIAPIVFFALGFALLNGRFSIISYPPFVRLQVRYFARVDRLIKGMGLRLLTLHFNSFFLK